MDDYCGGKGSRERVDVVSIETLVHKANVVGAALHSTKIRFLVVAILSSLFELSAQEVVSLDLARLAPTPELPSTPMSMEMHVLMVKLSEQRSEYLQNEVHPSFSSKKYPPSEIS